jgi:hypothetical protein
MRIKMDKLGYGNEKASLSNSDKAPNDGMTLYAAVETVQQLSNVAALLADRVEKCATRILGSQPEVATQGVGGPETDSAMSMLRASLTHLDLQLSRLENPIRRLENL